jgi:carnitine O-palmitoyltransferase 1, liver isoform
MAEARSIQFVGEELKRGVRLASAVDEDGVHFRVNCTIPPPRQCLRIARSRLDSARRWLYYSVFPWGIGVMLAVMTSVVAIVATADSESWWRNGWLAWAIWETAMWFPWVPQFPHEWKVMILAAWAGVVGFIILTALQRWLLKLLLSWKGFLYTSREPSLAVKAWFMAVKILSGWFEGRPLLYAFQGVLPRLPVPSLEDTVALYLESVQPIVSAEEFVEEEREAMAFLRDPGQGPRLQWYLNLKALTSTNYVTDWWEQYVYLSGRSPIAVNSNYYVLDAATYTPSKDQCARAAILTWSFLLYRADLEAERILPTRVAGGVPLCMAQFHRIFGTCRIPGMECDEIRHWGADESRHIAVLSQGVWYTVEIADRAGNLIDPNALSRIFREVQRDSMDRARSPSEEEASVSALTGWNRTRWAEARADHFGEGRARRALQAVERAAFVVRLAGPEADFAAEDWTARGRDLMVGNGACCWFDKSFNITVFGNGKMGINAEHAWADAPVMAHVMEVAMIVNESILDAYEADGSIKGDLLSRPGTAERMSKGGLSPQTIAMASGCVSTCDRGGGRSKGWTRLDWGLTDAAKRVIRTALTDVRALADDVDLAVVDYSAYGKGFMKKCGVSPDSFVQMALQLAYFQDQGHFDATYESSMTRLFLHGRTETIRSCSSRTCSFVRAMLDDSMPPREKLALLREASVAHVKAFCDSMAGKGIDRHLFALYVVSKGKDVDAPFLRRALGRPWRLSTSQQPQQQTEYWSTKDPKWAHAISPGGGFGPVTDEGYGVSYMVAREDGVYFHVSAKHSASNTDAKRFAGRIFEALDKMKSILQLALDEKKASKSKET